MDSLLQADQLRGQVLGGGALFLSSLSFDQVNIFTILLKNNKK
jgi:hypothetical protein